MAVLQLRLSVQSGYCGPVPYLSGADTTFCGDTLMTLDTNSSGNSSSTSSGPATLGRRSFLAAAATAATAALGKDIFARDYGPHAEPVRYPDPDLVQLDKRFAKYKIGNTPIQRLHTGML